jgi:hypothetical protein
MGMHRGLSRGLALAVLILAGACSGEVITPPPDGDVNLVVTADLAGTAATTVVVEVEGPGISPTLVFNLTVTNGTATGQVTVPAGSDRTFTVKAYDDGGILTHMGSHTMDVLPSNASTITITVEAQTGDVDITAKIQTIVVSVTATDPTTIVVGNTVQVSAAITDGDGAIVEGTVDWATRNTGVATVEPDQADPNKALVTGASSGDTEIVATFGGAAGAIAIIVTDS